MKYLSIKLFLVFFAVVLFFGCKENSTENKSDLPESFYLKVHKGIQENLKNLFDEVELGRKTNTEISQEYNSDLLPVDSLLRVLVRVRVNDISVKEKMNFLNCELKNENQSDLYYWIPIQNFIKVTELNEVLSVTQLTRSQTF